MEGIAVERMGQRGPLPGDDIAMAVALGSLDTSVLEAARIVAEVHRQCETVYVEDGWRDSAYREAAARRLVALETLIATPTESMIGLEIKKDILTDVEVWIGREDPAYCGLVIQLAHEAISLFRLHQTKAEGGTEPGL